MPNNIDNAADTSNIDDVIAYLESPEYLSMAARSAGENPRPLLSGSRGQGWTPVPEGTEDTREWLSGASMARVTRDIPGVGAPRQGDEVYIYQSRVLLPGGDLGYTVGGLGASDDLWMVEYDALTSRTRRPEPEPEPELNVPASALAPVTPGQENAPESQFGIAWDSENDRCVCPRCESRRQAAEVRESNTQTSAQLTTRRAWWVFRDVMASLRPFHTWGALRGVTHSEHSGAGLLGDRNPRAAILWSVDRPKIDYVVYSYDTPIAWHVNTVTGSEWVFPLATYSSTTSRHQSKIRTALESLSAQGYRVRILSDEREM